MCLFGSRRTERFISETSGEHMVRRTAHRQKGMLSLALGSLSIQSEPGAQLRSMASHGGGCRG